MAVWWGGISRRGKGRGTDEQLLADKSSVDTMRRNLPGSSNLNLSFSVAQKIVLC